jgi:hypothetical protein
MYRYFMYSVLALCERLTQRFTVCACADAAVAHVIVTVIAVVVMMLCTVDRQCEAVLSCWH